MVGTPHCAFFARAWGLAPTSLCHVLEAGWQLPSISVPSSHSALNLSMMMLLGRVSGTYRAFHAGYVVSLSSTVFNLSWLSLLYEGIWGPTCWWGSYRRGGTNWVTLGGLCTSVEDARLNTLRPGRAGMGGATSLLPCGWEGGGIEGKGLACGASTAGGTGKACSTNVVTGARANVAAG